MTTSYCTSKCEVLSSDRFESSRMMCLKTYCRARCEDHARPHSTITSNWDSLNGGSGAKTRNMSMTQDAAIARTETLRSGGRIRRGGNAGLTRQNPGCSDPRARMSGSQAPQSCLAHGFGGSLSAAGSTRVRRAGCNRAHPEALHDLGLGSQDRA